MRNLITGLILFATFAPAIADIGTQKMPSAQRPLYSLAQLQTVIKPSLPDLGVNDNSADTSPMVCRPPQTQSHSRLPGPKVCKTQRQWDDLHNQGLDISADGKSVVASEKYRSLHGSSCATSAACNH